MKPKLIELINVNVKYVNPEGVEFGALKDVNISIEAGEYLAIVGSSGSGKTTLANIIGMLNPKFAGSFFFDGEPIHKLKENKLVKYRSKHLGFIFQDYILLEHLSALENVSSILQYQNIPKKKILKMAEEKLISVGLGDKLHHKPYQLSGGQKQRVSIARALLKNPKIIIADEPTGALDPMGREEILSILQNLNTQGVTIVTITHSLEDALAAKRIVRIEKGHITEDRKVRNRVRYFSKLEVNDEEKISGIMNYLDETFGIIGAEDFIKINDRNDSDIKIKILEQFDSEWLEDNSVLEKVKQYLLDSDELVQLYACKNLLLSTRAEEISACQAFLHKEWAEETAMHFLFNIDRFSTEIFVKSLQPDFLFRHSSGKVRATMTRLLSSSVYQRHFDFKPYIDTLLTDKDSRVRSNLLDYLYRDENLNFRELALFHFERDPSARVRTVWSEMLIYMGSLEEAMKILTPMLDSSDLSEVRGALWVLAKNKDFDFHTFLKKKVRSRPEMVVHINDLLATYNRVKNEGQKWRRKRSKIDGIKTNKIA